MEDGDVRVLAQRLQLGASTGVPITTALPFQWNRTINRRAGRGPPAPGMAKPASVGRRAGSGH